MADSPSRDAPAEVTRILGAVQDGDKAASDELLPLVYGDLRKLAAARMAQLAPGQTLHYPGPRDTEHEIACPASPGDLLAHHAMTIHRADGNGSATRHRRALGFIYYSERAREDAAAHATYQRELAARLRTEGKI